MSLSPPVAKKAKLTAEKQISDLADADFFAIFEHLPPYDRLIVSEVSRRWYELSRKAWLDVTELDLSPIPGKHIGAVVKLCPNLQTVFALKKSFEQNELAILSRSNQLSTVKLYDCNFVVKSDRDHNVVNDGFASIFSENVQHASWSELILHKVCINDEAVIPGGIPGPGAAYAATLTQPKWTFSAACLPASLKRLQLSGLCFRKGTEQEGEFLDGLHRLQNLECFIMYHLDDVNNNCRIDDFIHTRLFLDAVHDRVRALKNLRELFIGPALGLTSLYSLGRLISSLPKLEVLLVDYLLCGYPFIEDLKELIVKNSVLRILLLNGGSLLLHEDNVEPMEIPARKRFPHGFGSDPLPLLHVFVGKQASKRLRFAESSSDAAVIHRTDTPMIEFLDQEDIATILEGVWVAQMIKEIAKHGNRLLSDDGNH